MSRKYHVGSVCAVLFAALLLVASASAKYSAPCGNIPNNGNCNTFVKFVKVKYLTASADSPRYTVVTIHVTPVNGSKTKGDIIDVEFNYGSSPVYKNYFTLKSNIPPMGENFTVTDDGSSTTASAIGFGVFGHKRANGTWGDLNSNWGQALLAQVQ
jgi:hypothetical protein